MPGIADWDGFYVIVGSAAGALIGLQFVVMTLISARPPENASDAGAAFSTPTIVHFGAALLLSALMHAPWQTIDPIAAIWGIMGGIGVIYMADVTRRLRKQNTYKPVFEDWLFHAVAPLAGYGILALSCYWAYQDTRDALFGAGAATLLLLFTGIHNAWDSAAYHVLVAGRDSNKQPERPRKKT